ncbi:MAG: hypothetical protein RL764_540 [Pseudomonadota bacterium]
MRAFLLLTASIALSGCVSSSKPLKNASGQVVECKASGFGWLGAPVAMISQSDCIRDMKRKGFVPIDQDPNDAMIPKGAANYQSNLSLPLPAGWELKDLNATQKAQGLRIMALNSTIDGGVIVSSIKRDAITDLTKYIESRRAKARSVGVDGDVTSAEPVTVNGREAFRYFARNTIGQTRIRYGYTHIVGKAEIALVLVWTNDAGFDGVKSELLEMSGRLQGFDQ